MKITKIFFYDNLGWFKKPCNLGLADKKYSQKVKTVDLMACVIKKVLPNKGRDFYNNVLPGLEATHEIDILKSYLSNIFL